MRKRSIGAKILLLLLCALLIAPQSLSAREARTEYYTEKTSLEFVKLGERVEAYAITRSYDDLGKDMDSLDIVCSDPSVLRMHIYAYATAPKPEDSAFTGSLYNLTETPDLFLLGVKPGKATLTYTFKKSGQVIFTHIKTVSVYTRSIDNIIWHPDYDHSGDYWAETPDFVEDEIYDLYFEVFPKEADPMIVVPDATKYDNKAAIVAKSLTPFAEEVPAYKGSTGGKCYRIRLQGAMYETYSCYGYLKLQSAWTSDYGWEGTNKPEIRITTNARAKITLSEKPTKLHIGETFALEYTITPDYWRFTNDGASFASSNTKVATVNKQGVIKAVGGGKATITATLNAQPIQVAKCEVSVFPKDDKLTAVKNLQFSAYEGNMDSLKLTWDKVSGAKGYHIWVKGPASKSFSRVKSVSSNIYKVPAIMDYSTAFGYNGEMIPIIYNYKIQAYSDKGDAPLPSSANAVLTIENALSQGNTTVSTQGTSLVFRTKAAGYGGEKSLFLTQQNGGKLKTKKLASPTAKCSFQPVKNDVIHVAHVSTGKTKNGRAQARIIHYGYDSAMAVNSISQSGVTIYENGKLLGYMHTLSVQGSPYRLYLVEDKVTKRFTSANGYFRNKDVNNAVIYPLRIVNKKPVYGKALNVTFTK